MNRYSRQLTTDPNTNGDANTLMNMQPDAVILATGATPLRPDIPGIDRKCVATAEDVLTKRTKVWGTVVVVGGGMVGCETAEFVLTRVEGVDRVVIVEMLGRIAGDVPATSRPFFLARLEKEGVEIHIHTTVKEITEGGVRVDCKGDPQFIEADTVVLSVGFEPDSRLARGLEGRVSELYAVGDCLKPRTIREAMAEGFTVGMKV
ncbi:MAG TPA: hypothetical protein DCR97_10535 [Deltaproteobacteria bacterium]|jgi:pyruvate/2-oxoglutarate dehydrogenase complex dihydrolipoamide dehydrogenase (E3) component|nr:hypothetical protein [Deltaproteobacteria bacterium]